MASYPTLRRQYGVISPSGLGGGSGGRVFYVTCKVRHADQGDDAAAYSRVWDAYSRVRHAYSRVRYAYSRVRLAYSRVRDAYSRVRHAYSRMQDAYSRMRDAYSRVRDSNEDITVFQKDLSCPDSGRERLVSSLRVRYKGDKLKFD